MNTNTETKHAGLSIAAQATVALLRERQGGKRPFLLGTSTTADRHWQNREACESRDVWRELVEAGLVREQPIGVNDTSSYWLEGQR